MHVMLTWIGVKREGLAHEGHAGFGSVLTQGCVPAVSPDHQTLAATSLELTEGLSL